MTDKTATANQKVYFDMTDIAARTCTIQGTLDLYASRFLDPPAPLVKGGTVRLVNSKFPFTDHTDNDNDHERLTVELSSGLRLSGILCGFTVDCTASALGKCGTPRFALCITPSSLVDLNNQHAASLDYTADSAPPAPPLSGTAVDKGDMAQSAE